MMVYVKLGITAVLWGGTFVAGRLLADGIGAFSATFLRFLLASCCLLWIVHTRMGGLPRLTPKEWGGVCVLGATGVLACNVLFLLGLQTVPAGRAAVIFACNPVVIAVFAALFFAESFTLRKALGLCCSIFGAIVAITRGELGIFFTHAVSYGDILIACSVASWIAYALIGKRMMFVLSPHAATTYSCIAGTVMLFPFAVHDGLFADAAHYTLVHALSIFYLGVLGTVVGFLWFYEAIREVGASRASVFFNFVPIAAIVSGWMFLGEPVTPSLVVGVLFVLGGVYIVNSGKQVVLEES
ncbi:MAG: DMT family transporter [Desulfovibrionales bacterium]|nr:DMT family transporter [Desulfovibrionales bacterium]